MRQSHHDIDGMSIHITEWGQSGSPVIVALHGYSRTGRDFDELAQVLAQRFHVICPDMPGRGLSSWANDPSNEYRIGHLKHMVVQLLQRLGIEEVCVVGTSMGGAIGIQIATDPEAPKVTAIVLNDVGPGIAMPGKDRIVQASEAPPVFDSQAQASAWLLEQPLVGGPPAESFINRMHQCHFRQLRDGRLTLHYDPSIVDMFRVDRSEFDLWQEWESLTIPVQLLWGRKSDVLTNDMVERMQRSDNNLSIVEFPEFGHAINLSNPDAISPVQQWLFETLGQAEASNG